MNGAMRFGRAPMAGLASLVVVALIGVGLTGAATAAASTMATAARTALGCPAHSRLVCVDRTDSGHSVHVRVGHTIEVVLGSTSLRWSGLHQVGPDLLRAQGRVEAHDGGITASYTAVKAGHTTLRAGGAPRCARGRACPQFILLWQVGVTVS
jgi:hypothetical protein